MRPVSAATLMLSSGASAFTSVVRPPVGNTMPRMSVVPRMQVPATLDDARVRTVCVALMGQYPKIEDMLESGGLELSELDFDGFSGLVETLEVQCTEPDKRAIFKMIDVDIGQRCRVTNRSIVYQKIQTCAGRQRTHERVAPCRCSNIANHSMHRLRPR